MSVFVGYENSSQQQQYIKLDAIQFDDHDNRVILSKQISNAELLPDLPSTFNIIITKTDNDGPSDVEQEYTVSGAILTNDSTSPSNNEIQTYHYMSIKVDQVCFCHGTRIRTLRGDIAVEDLEIGDLVVTASDELRPIRWLGHHVTDCRRAPETTRPIRVAAHAFGEGRPVRDLFLSPGHPVLVGADANSEGGHLVPIMCLINGTTIERAPVDEVTYWHVELDAHDILLAEGLPAESYIDLGSRAWFAGAAGALYDPDMALPGMPGRCRPVAIDGPVVEAERRRLAVVFALRLASAAAWPNAQEVAHF